MVVKVESSLLVLFKIGFTPKLDKLAHVPGEDLPNVFDFNIFLDSNSLAKVDTGCRLHDVRRFGRVDSDGFSVHTASHFTVKEGRVHVTEVHDSMVLRVAPLFESGSSRVSRDTTDGLRKSF